MVEAGKFDDSDIKRKNKLAVFEHLTTSGRREKPGKFNFSHRSISPNSDCNELVIDDQDSDNDDLEPRKKKYAGVKLTTEPLNLSCKWNNCPSHPFTVYKLYIEHIRSHILDNDDEVEVCQWENCNYAPTSLLILVKHVVYHGYHTKLMNIGNNVAERQQLPECKLPFSFIIPEQLNDYDCNYGDCDMNFMTIYDFLEHIRVHVSANPKHCRKGEFIKCEWIGCSSKNSSQYKLAGHLKVHTKEKLVGCPTCGQMFVTKQKFIDHRHRQLSIEMQSFQCSQCSKLFPSERLLRDHMRGHVNHYKCSMCDMTCPKPSVLAKHIRYRHLNERPYKCNLCEHASVTKENLEHHLISHCAEKLMACEECDFRCRSLYGLDRHYQKVHGEDWTQKYECHICPKRFQRGNFLTKHLIKDHDFNWPSGHSRFRYKEDTDGIYRLQTVRYESLEVTQEMMLTTSGRKSLKDARLKYDLVKDPESSDKNPLYILKITEEDNEKNDETEAGVEKEQSELIEENSKIDIGETKIVKCEIGTEDNTKNKINSINDAACEKNILITIEDVDEKGNILKTEVLESSEIICTPEELKTLIRK